MTICLLTPLAHSADPFPQPFDRRARVAAFVGARRGVGAFGQNRE
jgi:hypothetical protein